jgi:hypothetical protein
MSKRIALGPKPNIRIESVSGDLRLVGWENEEILLKSGDDQSLTVQQDGDLVSVFCRDDLSLNVPKDASLHIQSVDGDMSVRSLNGMLDVDTVNGDVALREVGQIVIGTVDSDFSLRGAKGDVRVKSIGGDASLREVDGSLTLDSVSDDLAVRGVGGNLNVNVDDDVVVHLDPRPGQEYSVLAGDDILVVLPPDANATLTLHGDEINVDWPGVEPQETTSRTVVLGDGSAKINLNAGGDLLVSSNVEAAESANESGNFAGMMFDWGNWGREMGQHWGAFGREMGQRVSKRAQEAAERASRKAEATARRTERHLERKFGRYSGRRGAHLTWSWDPSQTSQTPKADPVSDEERMTILRMLAEKKITSEEAEKLLSALEGGS